MENSPSAVLFCGFEIGSHTVAQAGLQFIAGPHPSLSGAAFKGVPCECHVRGKTEPMELSSKDLGLGHCFSSKVTILWLPDWPS